MTITRSFGTHYTIPGMASRHWTAGSDGIRRWCDNGQRVDTNTDTDLIAAMSADLPPIHAPRPLDEMAAIEADEGICANPIEHDNSDIAVSESVHFPGETK